jgi:hypothetical protein
LKKYTVSGSDQIKFWKNSSWRLNITV